MEQSQNFRYHRHQYENEKEETQNVENKMTEHLHLTNALTKCDSLSINHTCKNSMILENFEWQKFLK